MIESVSDARASDADGFERVNVALPPPPCVETDWREDCSLARCSCFLKWRNNTSLKDVCQVLAVVDFIVTARLGNGSGVINLPPSIRFVADGTLIRSF